MTSSSARAINVSDPELRRLLERTLDKRKGDVITRADMAALTRLDRYSSWGDVANLTGLEFAAGLTELRLGPKNLPDLTPLANLTGLTVLSLKCSHGGEITDVSPLTGMTNLTELDLSGHKISDLGPLACLENLTVLGLYDNAISDLGPLEKLTKLTTLDLSYNRIRDIRPLARLKKLKKLNLVGNRISDLAPLLADGESVIHLGGNPLSAHSLDHHIPALQSQGVAVTWSGIPIAGVRRRSFARRRVSYIPSRNERELIARLMDKARRGGYIPATLPAVFVSPEPPPLFVAYPELEDELEEDEPEPAFSKNGNRGRPETVSIEELLGVYRPQKPEIVIFEKGVGWFAQRFRVNEDSLLSVVLIHEIAHWIAHQLPKPGVPTWPTDLYILGDADVHEGWAQLMTFWVAEEVGAGSGGPGGHFKYTFEALNKRQSSRYHVYEQFKDEPTERIIASLEKLRGLPRPARLQDWRQAVGRS